MAKPELAPGAMTEQLYVSPYDGGWEFRILGPKTPAEVRQEERGQR